jgi:DNA polymerase (family X)
VALRRKEWWLMIGQIGRVVSKAHRLALAAVAFVTLAAFDLCLGHFAPILPERATLIVNFFELSLGITSDVAFVATSVDQFPPWYLSLGHHFISFSKVRRSPRYALYANGIPPPARCLRMFRILNHVFSDSMTTNAQVADLLRQYATALQLEGSDRFKIKAYRRAANTIESTDQPVAKLARNRGDLESLPGIGKAISGMIQEIVRKGKLSQLDRAISKLSPELVELATKPLLDPKQVLRVYKKLGINSLAQLKSRLDAGDIRTALGSRIEFHIRHGLDDRPRMLRWAAREAVTGFLHFMQNEPEVIRVEATGSLRRRCDTVGDLNFLAAGKSAASILKCAAGFTGVLSRTLNRRVAASFKLASGTSLTLRYTTLNQWGYNQIMATGSLAHINALRKRFTRARKPFTAKLLGTAAASEQSIYEKVGLAYIEPELREDRGEIATAVAGNLPKLIELSDLRGDLHMHTIESDGANSIVEMAHAAKERGYEYIAITDHSQSLKITNGLSEKRLRAQHKTIDRINGRLKGITVLKSAEVDILEDGGLDYPNSLLKEFDLTVCSIHSKFALDKQRQTERLMRAMDNPFFNILGHATGRLLLRREGYEIDIERLFEHARECGCYFEINSNPNRLDLSDEHAKIAKDAGVKVAVNTDAHSIQEMKFVGAGIDQARRAWLEPADVLNTYSLVTLKRLLAR